MKTEDAERYRRKSEECRANARTATDDFDRAAWLRLAEDWMELARSAKTDGLDTSSPPSSRSLRVIAAGTAREATKGPADCGGQKGTSQQRLQSNGRVARQHQRWPAPRGGKPAKAVKKGQASKSSRQAQSRLTMVTMLRRYNRLWTEMDDRLLLELRAAGRSSVFIGAVLKRSAQATGHHPCARRRP
jgi:hypothetical protein